MQTFFGKAADTVIQNAKNAYDTAGMSANQYMSNVSGFAMTLINSVAKRRQAVAKQDTSAQKEALKTQVSDLQSTLSKQYSARQRELANEQRQLQRALDAEVQARSEANEEALEHRSDALDEEYDRLSDTLAEEVDAYQKATDARIKEIDREYTERLKLTDWMSLNSKGGLERKYSSYFSIGDGYVFVFPARWRDKVAVRHDATNDEIVFSAYADGKAGRELLRIYSAEDSVSREDRISAGYMLLHTKGDSACLAYIPQSGDESDGLSVSSGDVAIGFSYIE
jgi:hypothetical protein